MIDRYDRADRGLWPQEAWMDGEQTPTQLVSGHDNAMELRGKSPKFPSFWVLMTRLWGEWNHTP